MPEPCTIPSCAMEWLLATLLATIGVTTLLSWDYGVITIILNADHLFTITRTALGVLFIISGVVQMVALSGDSKLFQRWSAFTGAIVYAVFAMILVSSPTSFYSMAAILMILSVSEFVVFALLRGARWKASLSGSSSAPTRSGS